MTATVASHIWKVIEPISNQVSQISYPYNYSYNGLIHVEGPISPVDPNPAISAPAVFPQSGHIRLEKRVLFQNCPHFFQTGTHQKVRTTHRGPIYQMKAPEKAYQKRKKYVFLIMRMSREAFEF